MDLAAATTTTVLENGMTVRTFNPVAGVASAQLIDVSNFQGNFNWTSAKAGVPNLAGGIFRLTQGLGGAGTNSPDPFAAHNHGEIESNGLHMGVYHFLDPDLSGAKQAEYHVSEAHKLGFTPHTMFWCDNETHGQSGPAVSACAQAYEKEMGILVPHNPGGVYTYINFAQTGNDAGLGHLPLWLAFPSSTAPVVPPPWTRWAFWQWGTRFAGGQHVDADAFNGTVAGLQSWINSFAPRTTGPVKHNSTGEKLIDLADSRNSTPGGWLARQSRFVTADDAKDITWTGPWYTES